MRNRIKTILAIVSALIIVNVYFVNIESPVELAINVKMNIYKNKYLAKILNLKLKNVKNRSLEIVTRVPIVKKIRASERKTVFVDGKWITILVDDPSTEVSKEMLKQLLNQLERERKKRGGG